jgi:hypothetical protein
MTHVPVKLLPAPLIPFSFNLCPCVEVAEAKAKAMDINNAHTAALLAVSLVGGFIENKHSTDVESLSAPLRLGMSIHPEGDSCFDLGQVLVLNDLPAWRRRRRRRLIARRRRWCPPRTSTRSPEGEQWEAEQQGAEG